MRFLCVVLVCAAAVSAVSPVEELPFAELGDLGSKEVVPASCKCIGGAIPNICHKAKTDAATDSPWCNVKDKAACGAFSIEECEKGVCSYWSEQPCKGAPKNNVAVQVPKMAGVAIKADQLKRKEAAKVLNAAKAWKNTARRQKTGAELGVFEAKADWKRARAFRVRAENARDSGIREFGLTPAQFWQSLKMNAAGVMINSYLRRFKRWKWKAIKGAKGKKERVRPVGPPHEITKMAASVDKQITSVQAGIARGQVSARSFKEGSKSRVRDRKTLNKAYKVELVAQDHQVEIGKLTAKVDAMYDAAYSMLHDKFPQTYLRDMAKELNGKAHSNRKVKLLAWAKARKKNPKARGPKPRAKVTADAVRALLGLESNMLKGAYLAYRMKFHTEQLKTESKEVRTTYSKSKALLAQARKEAAAANAIELAARPVE